jgi:competence protein ComEA
MLFTLALVGLAALAALFRSTAASRAPVAPAFVESTALPRAARLHPGSAVGHAARVVVYVAGEVLRPGVYELPSGSRTAAAIYAAGGLRASADAVAVNLASPLEDGEEIAVPARGEIAAGGSAALRGGRERRLGRHRGRRLHGAAGGRHRARKAPDQPVDLNSADATALETLPGIGPGLAERIVEFRDANGPFASLDDLLDVTGTSPRLIEELQPYALVGGR